MFNNFPSLRGRNYCTDLQNFKNNKKKAVCLAGSNFKYHPPFGSNLEMFKKK